MPEISSIDTVIPHSYKIKKEILHMAGELNISILRGGPSHQSQTEGNRNGGINYRVTQVPREDNSTTLLATILSMDNQLNPTLKPSELISCFNYDMKTWFQVKQ